MRIELPWKRKKRDGKKRIKAGSRKAEERKRRKAKDTSVAGMRSFRLLLLLGLEARDKDDGL